MMWEPFADRIGDAASEDEWEITAVGDGRIVLVNKQYGSLRGHVLVALLAGWWTLWIANAIYGFYSYKRRSERKVIEYEPSAVEQSEEQVTEIE
jgi:hypothetical protein